MHVLTSSCVPFYFIFKFYLQILLLPVTSMIQKKFYPVVFRSMPRFVIY
jgi:hypothetical protein